MRNKDVKKAIRQGKKKIDNLVSEVELPDLSKVELPQLNLGNKKPVKRKRCPFRKAIILCAVLGGIGFLVQKLLTSKDDGWTAYQPSAPYLKDSAKEPESETDNCQECAQESENIDQGYVGDNPPEGYSIKGNNSSMIYHTPGSANYSRTKADIWFNSEPAAQKAGYTKSQS